MPAPDPVLPPEAVEAFAEKVMVPVMDPKAALQSLRKLFAVVDPKEEVTILASSGRSYKLRTTLPARRQIRALTALEEALEAAWGIEVAPTEGARGTRLLALVKAALSKPVILEKVATAFGVAFPSAIAAELEKEKEVKVEDASDLYPHGTVAADLFGAEEMVEALLPLLARLVNKLLATMEAVTASQGQKKSEIPAES